MKALLCAAALAGFLAPADCPSGETSLVTGGSYRLHYTISRR